MDSVRCLYPMFLAFWYKLGGTGAWTSRCWCNISLGVATGLIVALLGARLFRHRLSGLVGGALFLLAPVPLYFEGELLIEPSYTFLICLGLLLLLHAVEAQGRQSALLWLLAGGLIGVDGAGAGQHSGVPRGLSALCRVALVAHAGPHGVAAVARTRRRIRDDDPVGNH